VIAKLLSDMPSVSLIDYVPDISQFYAECDAFILPSIDDGFGMALFEALANGVPSIATRNCGSSELLVDGRDALIIDAGSVQQIKDSLLQMYESPDLRARLELAGPAAIAGLQTGDVSRPYESGMDALLAFLADSKKVTRAA
jgi:glycosyltransferase involved in cell wall biosynthesis